MKNVLSKYRVKDEGGGVMSQSKVSMLQGKIDTLTDSIAKVAGVIIEAKTKAKDNKQANID